MPPDVDAIPEVAGAHGPVHAAARIDVASVAPGHVPRALSGRCLMAT